MIFLIDYEKLGLKVGLEIHQQLDTHKLFCNCPSNLSDIINNEFVRMLRPTQSEIGEVDKAALEEARKKLRFKYQSSNSACLVEADEEPPHAANEEAIDIVLTVACLLKSQPIDEIHFMRKIVIDGSNTCGFQRTALVATGGRLETSLGPVRIILVGLEEDAARNIEKRSGEIVYRLDRLGIPLGEVSTEPDIKTPEQAKETAEKIGSLFRATKKVKRGIGTIREDLNISISEGARVEIKGVQELKMIPKYIEEEVNRQLRLIEVKKELQARNITKVDTEVIELTESFRNTQCKIIKEKLEANAGVWGMKLEGFNGLLKDKLGPEFAQRIKAIGVKGIFHSDELPGYGINEREIESVSKSLRLRNMEAFVLVAEIEEKAKSALNLMLERARIALKGVPEETRDAQLDGSTTYSRPLPGRARMYPETDVPPISITKQRLERVRTSLPELFDEKVKRFVKEYNLNDQQAKQLIENELDELFEAKIKEGILVSSLTRILTQGLSEIEKEGGDISRISRDDYLALTYTFDMLKKGWLTSTEAIQPVLLEYAKSKKHATVEDAARAIGLYCAGEINLEKIIASILDKNKSLITQKGMNALNRLMGLAMVELRGKVNGKLVNELLTKKLKEYIVK